MVAQLQPHPHPILGAVAAAQESLKSVRETQPLFMIPVEKEAAVTAIARLEAMTAELKLRVVAAAGDAAAEAGARDNGTWLASVTRADFKAGRSDRHLAESLDRHWTRVAAGMADGLVSPAQAKVVVAVLDDLPGDLDDALVARAEAEMVDLCGQFRPSELRRLGRHLLEVVAPEIAEAEEAKRLERVEQQARERTSLRSKLIGDGLARTTIVHPTLDRDRLLTYLESYTSPRKRQDAIGGEEDRIPHHRRLGQAFCALLEHLDPAQLPEHGGDATTVMVTISWESLTKDLATAGIIDADLAAGPNLSATAARRLACTAKIIPVVLGGKGEILDLGRTRRLFSTAQRKAMRFRDRRCRAEGCTVPAAWTEAHHLKPWSAGGKTDLKDGVLACSWHHHRLHDPRFGYELLPNGDLRFHRRN